MKTQREVIVSMTEAEWQVLCMTAQAEDRTPNLQARRMLTTALKRRAGKEPGEAAIALDSSSNTRQTQTAAA